jgi:ubiquinone/menaquinone biosynthesis C-methylase UbiE
MEESQQAATVYNKIAKSYASNFKNHSEHIDKFLSLIDKNGKILDVGCGCGTDANYISSKGFTVVGIDLSRGMIRLAKENFPKIRFEVKDMRKLAFRPNSFEGILVAYSLIHIPKKDVLSTLKLLYSFLKKKGIIYVALLSGKSQELFISEPLKPNLETFLNVFSEDETIRLLRKSGFSIIQKYKRKSKNKEEFDFAKSFVLARKVVAN